MSSRTIVFTTVGSLGDLHPSLAIARELKRRGHRPLVMTLPFFRTRVEAAGVEFRPLRATHTTEPTPELMRQVLRSPRGVEFIIRQLIMPALRDAYADVLAVAQDREHPAALLVAHPLTPATRLAAEKLGLPWVSTQLAPMGMASSFDPPVAPGLSWLHRLMNPSFAAAAAEADAPAPRAASGSLRIGINRVLLGIGAGLMRPWSKPYLELRRELNLPGGGEPFLADPHSPDRVLALFSPLLGAPQHDWPAQTVQTGFPVFEQPDDAAATAALAQMDEFLHRGRPPIVFTLGSSAVMDPGTFFAESLAAARLLGRRALLVGAAAGPTNLDLTDVLHLSSAPYAKVFPFAETVVHQGGIGTTAEALRAHRPMLVVPFGVDQPDNAARIERLGAGLALPITRYRAVSAAGKLERLLGDRRFRDRALVVGSTLARENGASRAADALEDML